MIRKYWDKAHTFEVYIDTIKKKIASETNEEIKNKYYLSLSRLKRIIDKYILSDIQVQEFQKKGFKGKVLIIAEGWCGDCSQSIPIINIFFHGKNPVKILFRDENPDLMQKFLTNGNEAIPIVIFISEKNDVISHWGPRTKAGTEILLDHKKEIQKFNKEAFLSDLHNYYDSNRGNDMINEILAII